MSQCDKICRCDPERPREKYKFTIKEWQVKRNELTLFETKCRACEKTKMMPAHRYWCDECFYSAHGWCWSHHLGYILRKPKLINDYKMPRMQWSNAGDQ